MDKDEDKNMDEEKWDSIAGSKRSLQDGDESVDDGQDDGEGDFELDPEKRREVRKMRRVLANRRSARESRERRKKLLSDLQESVESLTSENTTLTNENLSLRRDLATLIEQSGGAASLSMIPNIQSLLQSTQSLSNLTAPLSASMAGGGGQESSKV
jgi:bZIP transcription factor